MTLLEFVSLLFGVGLFLTGLGFFIGCCVGLIQCIQNIRESFRVSVYHESENLRTALNAHKKE